MIMINKHNASSSLKHFKSIMARLDGIDSNVSSLTERVSAIEVADATGDVTPDNPDPPQDVTSPTRLTTHNLQSLSHAESPAEASGNLQ